VRPGSPVVRLDVLEGIAVTRCAADQEPRPVRKDHKAPDQRQHRSQERVLDEQKKRDDRPERQKSGLIHALVVMKDPS
jgi:hypothetical protein